MLDYKIETQTHTFPIYPISTWKWYFGGTGYHSNLELNMYLIISHKRDLLRDKEFHQLLESGNRF